MITSKLDYVIIDSKTVTSSDFTVKITFNDSLWDKWLLTSRIIDFKEFLKEEIESQVSALPCHDENSDCAVQVASMHFAYDNKELILLLR